MAKRRYLEQWKVIGSKGDEYKVSLTLDHAWQCACPRWIFNRKKLPDGKCKHILAKLAEIEQRQLARASQANEALAAIRVKVDDEYFSLEKLIENRFAFAASME